MKFVEFPHEDTFDYDLQRICKNCDQKFNGRYCNRCGEEVLVPTERSFPLLFRKTFANIPILDNKFTRTLRYMVTKPGFVSLNYIQGRRIPFVDPLAMFLVVNLLYFLFSTNHSYNSSLRTQMHFQLHNEAATQMVERHLQEENINLEEFTSKYDLHAGNVAKIMLICLVVIFALPVWIANYSSGFLFRDHLIVSMEFCSMTVLINNLLIPWIWIASNRMISADPVEIHSLFNEVYLALIMGTISFALFYMLERRVYGLSRRRAFFLSMSLLAGLFISLHLYYGVVFFVSMWTI